MTKISPDIEKKIVTAKAVTTAIAEIQVSFVKLGLTLRAANRLAFQIFNIDLSPDDFADDKPANPLKKAA